VLPQHATLEENDVVIFATGQSRPSLTTAVGVITRISTAEGLATIEELGQDEQDTRDGVTTWVEAGQQHNVPIDAIVRVLQADFSQRMDADRVSNPHGEHAHDVWEILDPVEPRGSRASDQ
jgi:hypothetical protein